MAAEDGDGEGVRVLQNLRGKIYFKDAIKLLGHREPHRTVEVCPQHGYKCVIALCPGNGGHCVMQASQKSEDGEAKNLVPYSGPNKMRDCFCTINLDQEEVFRTQVVEKSLSPFFGEEFYFEIPRTFQCLSFYIYDKSVLQRVLRIGKVAIKKEDLCKYTSKETWFLLQPVDSNSEVQGKVHLELKLNELITDNGSVCQQLVVNIKECHGLPLVNGQNCDPYATVSLVGPSRIDLWNNGNLVQDVFLGEIKVPVKVLGNDSFQAWYLLQPRENGNKSSKTDDLGSLRLNVCYTEDYVLPSEYYVSLRNLLLKSPDVQPVSASAAYILGEVCRDKYDAVLPLVRLLLHHHKIVQFVTAVAELDLKDTQEVNTIFRGNTLATRCLDEMMKIVGKHYLKVTLKPVLDEICESPKPCEIDPIKLKEGDNVEVHKENLRYYVDKVFNTIVQSSISCPTLMCDVFYSLRHLAAKRFPNDPHVQYSAVSSFVFLRFFAVAVVSPHTFHLRPHYPFLDEVSSTESKEPSGMSEPLHLKEGEMYKRAQGRTRIGKKNFKKRWFCLTSRELTYHKQREVFWRVGPADIQIEIDGDRETERIYSLFAINMPKLQKMEEACGSIAVYQGPQKELDDYSNFTIEDSVATFQTLQQIIAIVEKLNEPHEKYRKKRSSSAKYGSEHHTTASMEPAQITLAIRSTLNTTRIIQQYMQNQNLAKRNWASRRCQRGDESDEDMDTDFSQSTGRDNVVIMVLMGQVHAVECQFWAWETSTDWWDRIVLQVWDDSQWLRNFRMPGATAWQAMLLERNGCTNYPFCTLEITHVPIDAWSMERLGAAFPYSNLNSIVLDYTKFGDKGINGLVSGLEGNRKLLTLSLCYCSLEPESGSKLGPIVAQTAICLIKHSEHLIELDLDGNAIGELCATDILEALTERKKGGVSPTSVHKL
ncbi:Ras GTPase-activating protein 2 [Chelonia mydas]|uniref:Ras GTPase-activating protein 2 n=1 Tax=Chelonia mydas TaxID=8469 RepID=M7BX10_CHEMY|nr:Ras GTPase-activating protein 2 [Chelonia mydas]